MNQNLLKKKQRNLKMAGGDATMNEAGQGDDDNEPKLDPMPILLFGDYDIEITKGWFKLIIILQIYIAGDNLCALRNKANFQKSRPSSLRTCNSSSLLQDTQTCSHICL